MHERLMKAGILGLALAAFAAGAQQPPQQRQPPRRPPAARAPAPRPPEPPRAPEPARADADEPVLREEMLRSIWPADIAQLAREYVRRYPASPHAQTAQTLAAQAADAESALGEADVRLFRNAFEPRNDPAIDAEVRRAALGDKDAAVRLARMHRRDGEALDLNRYLGWLQYASMLGHEAASYELALFYRKEGQPALAAKYESRAVELGYQPPRSLDHSRK